MALFGMKREKEVEELITKHFSTVRKTLAEFSKMMELYLNKDDDFKNGCYEVHQLEHEADIIRRNAQVKMHQGAFLPIYREDYIFLLELVDGVANKAESTSDFVILTRPEIPTFLEEGVRALVSASVETFRPLERMHELFQEDIDKVIEVARSVEEREQMTDKLQWDLTKALFKSDLDLSHKMHVKHLIDYIATIADRIEDVSDRLEVMVVKRSM